jgi:hypothetical protein
MTASTALRTSVATHITTVVTHIGLVDAGGNELTGGTYARLPAAMVVAAQMARPAANLNFSVPAGSTVGGWRGYSALSGGTDWGGDDLVQESYTADGTYTLLAASTGYPVTAI